MRVIKIIAAVLFSSFLFACVSNGASVVTGEARPEISPDEVKIYLDPPAKYETIGTVETSRKIEFSRQQAQDKVIEDLKKLAAKMGANGVLVTYTGSQTTGSTGGFSVGLGGGGISAGSGGISIGGSGGLSVGTGNDGERIIWQGRAIYVTD